MSYYIYASHKWSNLFYLVLNIKKSSNLCFAVVVIGDLGINIYYCFKKRAKKRINPGYIIHLVANFYRILNYNPVLEFIFQWFHVSYNILARTYKNIISCNLGFVLHEITGDFYKI